MSINLVAAEIERKQAKVLARQQITEQEILTALGALRNRVPEFYRFLVSMIKAAELNL